MVIELILENEDIILERAGQRKITNLDEYNKFLKIYLRGLGNGEFKLSHRGRKEIA